MSDPRTPTLSEALDALGEAAQAAGIDAGTARAEGESLAATVAEPNRRAFIAWAEQTGRGGGATAFFEAAIAGRRFRAGPTPTLALLTLEQPSRALAYARALDVVAHAASELGEPDPRSVGNAAVAGAAQLGVAAVAPTPVVPSRPAPGETQTQAHEPPLTAERPEPAVEAKGVEELLAELDALVGLVTVKSEIHRQAAVLRVEGLRKDAGLDTPTITRHLVFNGNPGTGKTTVARLVAGIYRALGLLSKGQLVEVDRSELVAGYLGQTAAKTAEVVKSAEGGVLFIDEAYGLSGDQYGKEAIDTLVKEMEDKRNDLVVIVAGYPLPMAIFISENPGLESRFRTTIDFVDYTDEELVAIFSSMSSNADFDAGPEVLDRLREILAEAVRGPSFGNARFVRNLLEAAIGHHAWRLRDVEAPSLEELRRLAPEDLVVDPNDVARNDVTEAPTAPETDQTEEREPTDAAEPTEGDW